MTGTVFDLKEFSIHDGPGGRVTVFLKGCPLRCLWCHNPEGLSPKAQLLHKKNLCSGCGLCQKGCNHPECQELERCVHICPNGANTLSGYETTPEALAQKLRSYEDFFKMTRGGVTVSGGEPMAQSEFVCALTDRLPGIHKALQTSGYASPDTYQRVVSRFDYIMQDIKLADGTQHQHFTGVRNEIILQNIDWLKKSGKEFVFRVPLIPNITDSEKNLRAISQIAEGHPVELLKYNALAGAKYEMLGIPYPLSCTQNQQTDFTAFFRNASIR